MEAYPYIVRGTPDLAAYWQLGEPSGTTAEDETGDHPGTYSGSYTLAQDGAVQASSGKSAAFAGGRVTVADAAALKVTAFTVAAWIYPTTIAGDFRGIVCRRVVIGDDRNYYLFLDPATSKVFGGFCTAPSVYTGYVEGNIVPLNRWTHVVLTYDGTTLRIFQDGVQTNTQAVTATPSTPAASTYIGELGGGFNPFIGRIDDVAIYARALTAAEIAMHYQAARRRGFGLVPSSFRGGLI